MRSDDGSGVTGYKPSGCRIVIGVLSIVLGVALLVTMFPYGLIPCAVLVGGGCRLIWNIGSL